MARVTFLPSQQVVDVKTGTSLLDAAAAAGVEISAPCGGDGACGECRVRIRAGDVEKLDRGSILSAGEDWVLACSSRVSGDVSVLVPEEAREGQIVVESALVQSISPAHPRDSFTPLVRRVALDVAPPSSGNSLSDFDRLHAALRKTGAVDEQPDCSVAALRQLAVALRSGDHKVTVSFSGEAAQTRARIAAVWPGDRERRSFGLAIDIGTTTCAAHLVQPASGRVLGTASEYNRQRSRGADVISRINYARTPTRLEEMRALVLESLNALISELCSRHGVGIDELESAVVAGNTTMIHLLLGLDPEQIRLEPYTPTVNSVPTLRASEVGLHMAPEGSVCFAPGVGSYVGGDITAGLLGTVFAEASPDICLFLDIGTNGEIVVGNNEWLMACAASAGPAFEGFGVQCGMRAMHGAIERIRLHDADRAPEMSVIGGGDPLGLCGSGLIDLLAELKDAGVLDPAGRLHPEYCGPGRNGNGARNLCFTVVPAARSGTGEDIVISDLDILNLLRAKAAVYAACSLMLKSVGLDFEAVSRVYVAGGFGRFLDLRKSIQVGMLPDLPLDRFVYLGNSALAGAKAMLVSKAAREKAQEFASRLTYLELNVDPSYMDEYVAALFLPHTDLHRFPSLLAGAER